MNCAFATFVSNSYGGSFKISLPPLPYQFIRCFQILPVFHWRPYQVIDISPNPFNENKWYAKLVVCHLSKLVKDKHNVILILVSSSKFNSLFRRFINILDFICSSFLFRSSKFSALSRHKAPSKSLQGFTLCFQLLFHFIILLLPEFFMEAIHGGSSRI